MILKYRLLLRRIQGALPLLFLGALFLYSLWPWLPLAGGAVRSRTIVFYGFSILDEVMNKRLFPAFSQEWQARTGEHIEFISSFAGSGTIANQLMMGVPAELALLSLELDAQKLSKAGVIGSHKR